MGYHTESDRIQHGEHEVGMEFSSLSHCTRYYSGGSGGEGQLKQEDGKYLTHGLSSGINKKTPNSDERVCARVSAETESKAKGPVCDATEHDIEDILHHNVDLIFMADTSGLEHTKPLKHRNRQNFHDIIIYIYIYIYI